MQNTTPADTTAVIVISSHVVRGSVGNRAAVFALETLGHPVWAVPTIILPWHTGHGRADRILPEVQQFKQLMEDLERAPWIGEVGAVLTGYMGNAEQPKAIAQWGRLVSRFWGLAVLRAHGEAEVVFGVG